MFYAWFAHNPCTHYDFEIGTPYKIIDCFPVMLCIHYKYSRKHFSLFKQRFLDNVSITKIFTKTTRTKHTESYMKYYIRVI